jgi:hypothetical protein
VNAREIAIENDNVVLDEIDLAKRAIALIGDVHGHRAMTQPPGHRVRQPPLILDDQDPHLHFTVRRRTGEGTPSTLEAPTRPAE